MNQFSPASVSPRAAAAVTGFSPSLSAPSKLWASGPPSESVAELLRTLELTVNGRLDGVLHGQYQGFTPGHGSEPGESRLYQPGDDVRRIDWNVTARTRETHVRDQIADRDLAAWLVVDVSASMQFGTCLNDKAQVAVAAAAAVGFLTARNQNRLGAVLVAGPLVHVMPPRSGANQVRAVLSTLCDPPVSEGLGPSDLAGALGRVGAVASRRGFVAVISDFAGDSWHDPLARVGLRHDVLAVVVSDPREFELPPVGVVDMVDPATGECCEVRVTAKVRARFAQEMRAVSEVRDDALRRSGADVVELSTDDDWLAAIVKHSHRRRVQMMPSAGVRR